MKHKKRFYQSNNARRAEHMGMERYERGPVLQHQRDKHNDESRSDSEGYMSGPYHYDRQAEYRNSGIRGEYYAGAEPRRRQEMADAGMIHEDHRQVSNLPQEVRYYPYPKASYGMPEDIDDTLRGVDEQIGFDNMKRAEHFFPKKY